MKSMQSSLRGATIRLSSVVSLSTMLLLAACGPALAGEDALLPEAAAPLPGSLLWEK